MNFLMVNCSWVSNFFFGKEERESVIFVLHFLFCIIIVSMSLLFFFFGFTGSSLLRATFSSCSQRGLLLQLWCAGVSLWTCGLNSCVTQAWLPHGMQDPPGPRIKPTYPALASGFLTPGPPGMSTLPISICLIHQILMQNSPLWLWFLWWLNLILSEFCFIYLATVVFGVQELIHYTCRHHNMPLFPA